MAPTCWEALLTLDHRAPARAAGPTGRTKARAVEESISRTVAVGAPMIMVCVAFVCVCKLCTSGWTEHKEPS